MALAWREPPPEETCSCLVCAMDSGAGVDVSRYSAAEVADAAEWASRERDVGAADLYQVLVDRHTRLEDADVSLLWRLVRSLEFESRAGEAERAARRFANALGLDRVGPDLHRYLVKLDAYEVAKCPAHSEISAASVARVLFTEDGDGGAGGASGNGPPLAVMSVSGTFVPRDECAWAVATVERHVASHGWTKTRHAAVPTTDVPVEAVPELLAWFNRRIMRDLLPRLCPALLRSPTSLRVVDAFFVKYCCDKGGQRGLPVHTDQGAHCVSAVVAMNDGFQGGGTLFADADLVACPPTGGALIFRGGVVPHGGVPLTQGTRFILALFLAQA